MQRLRVCLLLCMQSTDDRVCQLQQKMFVLATSRPTFLKYQYRYQYQVQQDWHLVSDEHTSACDIVRSVMYLD